MLEQCAEYYMCAWNITDCSVITSHPHYVVHGICKGQEVVLKVNPDYSEACREVAALRAYEGARVVKVLAEALHDGVYLMECAVPGEPLFSFFPERDAAATEIAASFIKELHAASFSSGHFIALKDWLRALWEVVDVRIPSDLLTLAHRYAHELLTSQSGSVLLHADLHHSHILSHKGDWMLIDPRGLVGDPCYDVAPFMVNPLGERSLVDHPYALKIISTRLDIFELQLGYSRDRMLRWSFVYAILAACWMVEDQKDPAVFIPLARILKRALH